MRHLRAVTFWPRPQARQPRLSGFRRKCTATAGRTSPTLKSTPRRVQVGSRHAGARARSRQARAEHRGDAHEPGRHEGRRAAARQDPQVGRHREAAARGRRRRHLHGQAQRGGDALRRGHAEDLHDHRESQQGEDSARDEAAQEESRVHPGRRLSAERAAICPTPRRPPASPPTSSSMWRSARAAACPPAIRRSRWRS